jgi:membrane protease YdiL (CAAX protease family)
MAHAGNGLRWFVLFGILFEAGLGGAAWLVGWLLGQPPLEDFHWDARDALLGATAAFPMLIGFFACVRWPVGSLKRIKQFSEEVIRPLFAPCTLFELGVISLSAGVGEEMLFRGLLQGGLSRWGGLGLGFAVANVLFGLAHLITPTYAVLATAMGVYLGGWWLATGNLLVPIVAHALYDFVALAYLVRGQPPEESPVLTGLEQDEG